MLGFRITETGLEVPNLGYYWHGIAYRHKFRFRPGVGTLHCCIGRWWWPFAIMSFKPEIRGCPAFLLPRNDMLFVETLLEQKTAESARSLLEGRNCVALPTPQESS